MLTEVPFTTDAKDSLSYDELQSTTPPAEGAGFADSKPSSRCSTSDVIQHRKEVPQSDVTVQTKFSHARGLIKSPKREHQVEGVGLLQALPLRYLTAGRIELSPPPRYLPQRVDSLKRVHLLSRPGIL